MSYHVVGRPERSRIAKRIILVAIVGVVGVALTAGWAASRPSIVSVDGVERELGTGTTVADLRSAKVFRATSGDVIGIDGSVVETSGGEPFRILRNGRPATPNQVLYNGDLLVSRAGTDVRESLEVTEVPIPFLTVYQGKGPLLEEREHGVTGSRLVTRGALSGVEVSSTVLTEPRDAVVQRIHPRPGARIVALTFDDGPWPTSTAAILNVLKREKVPATFFVLGVRVKMRSDLANRMVAEGHQIASHSYSHKNFTKVKPTVVSKQIKDARRIIKSRTGVDTKWLRPPYGAMNARAWKVVGKEHVRVVSWDVDSRDWTKPGVKKIVAGVIKHTRPGSIVLMHDGGGNRAQTVKALPTIIKKLRAKGYTFVTVEELYAVRANGKKK